MLLRLAVQTRSENVDELKALMDEKAYAEYLEKYDSDDEYQPI